MLKHHMSKQNQFRNICHKRYYSSILGGDLLLVFYNHFNLRDSKMCCDKEVINQRFYSSKANYSYWWWSL